MSPVQDEAREQGYRTWARGLTTHGATVAEFDLGDDGLTAPDGGRPPPAGGRGKTPKSRGRGWGRGRM